MQRRLELEMGVNKPFENVPCQGRIQNFFQGGHRFSSLLQAHFLPPELILSNLSNKNDSKKARGHAPSENFENFHTAMAILVLFKQFLGKVCHIFGP